MDLMLGLIHLVFAPSFGNLKWGEWTQVVKVVVGSHSEVQERGDKKGRTVTTQNSSAHPKDASL